MSSTGGVTVSRPVYLDHAASTDMVPDAVEAMTRLLSASRNPASLHGSGRLARRHLEEARESIAADLGARPSEVIFTSGGTESDNLALKGIFWARRDADPRRTRIVVSAVEHHAVLDTAQWLADHQGARLSLLPVDADGRIDPADLRTELAAHPDEVAVVSMMWANNEVGVIQPIAELSAIAQEFEVPIHSDAVQAVGHVPVAFGASGLSAMTLTGHKFGGPRGIGALLLGRQVDCVPLLHGGGHERDVRSGTPDVAAAAGLAAALRWSAANMDTEYARISAIRDRLFDVLLAVPDSRVNGATGSDRLPGNAHVSFRGCDGDSLLMLLDANGIECSTGSACTAGVARASHVLMAMNPSLDDARGSLRFSVGTTNSDADVDAVADVIGQVVDRARMAGLTAAGRR